MGASIMLIEDDQTLRRALRDWLRAVLPDVDLTVDSRDNRPTAAAETQAPEVILVDVDVAGAEGIRLIRDLTRATPAAKVVALAMDDHEALRRDARAAGAAGCVSMTSVGDHLLPMLRELLDEAPVTSEPRRTVLCIEDEVEMIKLIQFALERGPFRVIGAVSGQQGLEMARQVKPDVVLLDLMMPVMDGWEVCREMKEDQELKTIPVVAVTVLQPSKARARELDVDGYVTKPFAPDDLMKRVSEVTKVVA